MTSKAQKIKLGVFVIATASLLALVLVVFGGLRLWETRDRYYIVFDESVLGLVDGAEVTFAGIRVGSVKSITLAPGDATKVRVAIEVKEGQPIRGDTTAVLSLAGITGLKVIDLRGGSAASPRLAAGSVIPTGQTMLDKLEQQAKGIVDQSTEIMGRANQVMANLEAITKPSQYASIEELFANAKAVSANMALTSAELQGMVSENRTMIRASLASVDQATKSANALLVTANGLVANDLPKMVVNANAFVDDLRGVVRTNQTHLGSALFDLRQASRSFKDLARDLRQRPSRLLLSTPTGERKLP